MFFTMRVRENYQEAEIVSVNSDSDPKYQFILEASKGNALVTMYLEADKFEQMIMQGLQLLQERDRNKINETL